MGKMLTQDYGYCTGNFSSNLLYFGQYAFWQDYLYSAFLWKFDFGNILNFMC